MQKHSQLVEAEKQLAIAQDAYCRAVDSLDRQYVKPLVGAADGESDEIADLRSRYFEFSVERDAVEGEVEGEAAPKRKPRKPRVRKEQQ